MHRSPLSILAAAATLLLVQPARAQTTMTLQSRSSVNHFYWYGGFAVSGDEGEDGAPAPVPDGPWEGTVLTGFADPTLAITGARHFDIHYLGWLGFLEETWDQAQTYSFGQGAAGAELRIAGHAADTQTSQVCGSPCFLASELHRSTNTVALEFTLDAASTYTLSGSTAGGQYVDLMRWDTLALRWSPVVFGAVTTIDTSFALAGSLSAGRYLLRNDPYTLSGGGAVDVYNSWDATLVLQGAIAAPVPEPAPAVLLALGLVAVLLLRRRGPPA